MPRSTLRSACVLLVLALTGCDGTSGPSGVEGRYTVHTVNGEWPPVAVRGPSGSPVQVVDATILLRADREASVEVSTRAVAQDGTTGGVERTTYSGTFEQTGDVLSLGFLESAEGRRVRAEGVVISGREVAVTLHIFGSPSGGYLTTVVSIIARR